MILSHFGRDEIFLSGHGFKTEHAGATNLVSKVAQRLKKKFLKRRDNALLHCEHIVRNVDGGLIQLPPPPGPFRVNRFCMFFFKVTLNPYSKSLKNKFLKCFMYKVIEELSNMTLQFPSTVLSAWIPMSGSDCNIFETLKIHYF